MATDTVLAERMPASQPAVQRRGAEAMLPHRDSDHGGQPYMYDTAGLAASTRQTGASNDSSPSSSSPFPSGTKVKNDSFGSSAAYRHRHTNNAENATDNRRITIVPPPKVNKSTQGPAKGDETAQQLSSAPSAIQPTLPSPSAGCRRELVVDAQLAALAASGSALVAPPDTNPVSLPNFYSSLTPSSPSSSASLSPTTPKLPHSPTSSEPAKSRTARSRGHSRTPSRDVGIVGTLTRREPPQDLAIVQDAPSGYQPPIFQTPSSRSSSLDTTLTPAVDTTSLESNFSPQTASSGESHVHPTAMSASVEPIHNAHVTNGHGIHTQPQPTHPLDTSLPHAQLVSNPEQSRASPAPTMATTTTSVSAAPSSYLYYQPGVHSKAGPLPPPPRAMFDIDFNAPPPPRPPRRHSPSPLTSQKAPGVEATASVTVRLASKASTASIHQIHVSATPRSTQSSPEDSDYSAESEHGPAHQREGAFPPSTILVTPTERQPSLPDKSIRLVPEVPAKDVLPKSPTDILDSAPAITVQPVNDEPASSTARPAALRRETSWISNSNDSGHVSSEGSRRAFEDARPPALNRSYSSIRESSTEDSPTEPKRKGGILTNLKRYSSLPRPPSARSPKLCTFPQTPSPPPRSPPKPRIRARSPDALRFKDILNKKSALERATAYAIKINELSMYDCGLSDWVTTVKEKGSSKSRLAHASPSQSPDGVPDPQPSRLSISSEMTFALRADAYIATDLSQRDIDTVPSPNAPPPALPYPALAGVPPAITAIGGAALSHSPSLSVGAKVTAAAGLLSSLGRNASTRMDIMSKPTEKLTRSSTRTTKQSLTSPPNPRPVLITSAPSVPGGPRALPGRVQRSQTLMLSSSPPSSGNNPLASLPMRRRSNTLKRPSFFGRSPGPSPELDTPTNTEFTRQVERLADLLPHADKDVLAGYLSRAGQDILAIGQYLEDEKNGNVRRH